MNNLMLGMCMQKAETPNGVISTAVRNFLFVVSSSKYPSKS